MHYFYESYYSQKWYQNTFLVNKPSQIARVREGRREWNSVRGSGCHFTCLAMITGVDPAALASALARNSFFKEDSSDSCKATSLAGQETGLVWDQNRPCEAGDALELNDLWLPRLGKSVKLALSCYGWDQIKRFDKALKKTRDIVARGNHIVCGPDDHSVLVAGVGKNGPFIWDPSREKPSDSMLAGRFTMKRYMSGLKGRDLLLYEYSLRIA